MADFVLGEYGVIFRLENKGDETIIVESINAVPHLFEFSVGHELKDIARAVVRIRESADEDAIAILEPTKAVELQVIIFDQFKPTPADQKIKVTLRWRASSRSMFSRRTISKTITVKVVTDLVAQSHRRRMHPR